MLVNGLQRRGPSQLGLGLLGHMAGTLEVGSALGLAAEVEQVVLDDVSPLGLGEHLGVVSSHPCGLHGVLGRLSQEGRVEAVFSVQVRLHQSGDNLLVGRVQRQVHVSEAGGGDGEQAVVGLGADNQQRSDVVFRPVNELSLCEDGSSRRQQHRGVVDHLGRVHVGEVSGEGILQRNVFNRRSKVWLELWKRVDGGLCCS